MRKARAQSTAAEMSRAVGTVHGRRAQGLSVLQGPAGSVNMLHRYEEMLRPCRAGLEHRLDGDAVERR